MINVKPSESVSAGHSPTIWHVGGEDIHLRIPLLLALRSRGFKVGAVGSQETEAFAACNIPYFRYPLNRQINPIADWQTQAQLQQLLQQHQPDVIHAFDTKPAILAPKIAQQVGIPGRIRTITGMGYVFSSHAPLALLLRPIYRHLQRHASAAATITVFQNPDDQNYFRKHGMVGIDRDALVLGSGIDVEQFVQSCPSASAQAALQRELGLEGKLVVTMIARLVATKGVREFLEAASQVQNTMNNIKFLLVGPLISEGKQAISIQEIDQKANVVSYLGIRKDIAALLALSDLVVLPSYYREGIPRILLEAGAMGCPLITTDMPGCREVVRDRWNGLLIPPRNAIALAQAIRQLLNAPSDRQKMGSRSKQHIQQHFSLQRVADDYAHLYQQTLARQSTLGRGCYQVNRQEIR